MRLSIIKGDRGYQPPHACARYAVFLDGVAQTSCEVADEEGGYVKTLKRFRNPLTRQVQTQRRKIMGKVEIKELA